MPIRPVLLALEELPPESDESWPSYRRRAAAQVEAAAQRAARIPGITIEPLLVANALHGHATEDAIRQIREGVLEAGASLIDWRMAVSGEQMNDVVREIGLGGGAHRSRHSAGCGITVAVLDSGIDAHHPCLAVERSVSTCPEPVGVPGRHGTHCAGVIASRSSWCPGIAPGVRLFDIKVARADGSTKPGWIAKGIDVALDLGADILSISFGLNQLPASIPHGHGWSCPHGRCILCRAVEHAVALGAIVVAAAGNEHLRVRALREQGEKLSSGAELLCPGRARSALTVGALRKAPHRRLYAHTSWDVQNSGKPEVLAPGVDVTSTILSHGHTDVDPSECFGAGTGTSVAAAVVAGAVALLVERLRRAGSSCSPSSVRDVLFGSFTEVRVDGARTLDLARLTCDPVWAESI